MVVRFLLGALTWLALSVLPVVLVLRELGRRRPRLPARAGNLALVFGVLAGVIAVPVEHTVLRVTGIEPAGTLGATVPLLVAVAFVAPVEEGLKLAAVWPSFAARHLRGTLESIFVSSAATAGFVLVKGIAVLFVAGGVSRIAATELVLLGPVELFLSAVWAYLLGRSRGGSTPRRGFFVAWIAAVVAHGVFAHLASLHSVIGLLAAAPLLFAMAAISFAARGEIAGRASGAPLSRRSALPPTSIREVREALRRRDRPTGIPWILVGALVNQGVLFGMLAMAVVVGRRVGIDFAGVDDGAATALAPLALLASAAVAAFPLAGFLVARASDAPTMLEPALSAALSLVVLTVVLGVAAPIALAFALACAPIALLLACAGAWVGMGR